MNKLVMADRRPLVVLLGDSTRLGYQATVVERLEPFAQVWGSRENGYASDNILEHLGEWVLSKRPDIVHLNCGLHDLRRDRATGKVKIPLEVYRANLERIFRTLSQSASRVLWATSTPIDEAWHHQVKTFDRHLSNVERYNRVSVELCKDYGIEVNDLFSAVHKIGLHTYLLPDGVHYTEAGYRLLGEIVAARLERCLMPKIR